MKQAPLVTLGNFRQPSLAAMVRDMDGRPPYNASAVDEDENDNEATRRFADQLDENISIEIPCLAPDLLPRDTLICDIMTRLSDRDCMIVSGASGTGKSTLLRRLLRDRSLPQKCVVIDCSGLRMFSARNFTIAASWAVFGRDDGSYQDYLSACASMPDQDPVRAILEARLAEGDLIIIDHAEFIADSKEVFQWVFDLSASTVAKTIICDRLGDRSFFGRAAKVLGKSSANFAKLVDVAPVIVVDNFTIEELDGWFNQEFFHRRNISISGSDLFSAIGGCPSLVRDFGNWAISQSVLNDMTLANFVRRRSRGYLANCERYLSVLRRRPKLMAQSASTPPKIGADDRDGVAVELISTGVVRTCATGELVYTSRLHRKRIELLTSHDVLCLALLRSERAEVWRPDWQDLKRVAELAVDPIVHLLTNERSPRHAIEALGKILRSWGFNCAFHMRDRGNGRLLLRLPDNEVIRLSNIDFVKAVQLGRSVVTDCDSERPNELIVPILGHSGAVEMLVSGTYCRSDASLFDAAILRDRYVTLLRGLRFVLCHIIDRFWSRRQQLRAKGLLYMTRPVAARGNVLRSLIGVASGAEPNALAILSSRRGMWNIGGFHIVRGIEYDGDRGFGPDDLDPVDHDRLSRIASHPSGHGLALTGASLAEVFPKLERYEQAAIFLRPVWSAGTGHRLLSFVFFKQPKGGLDGNMQQYLYNLAPSITNALLPAPGQQGQWWR